MQQDSMPDASRRRLLAAAGGLAAAMGAGLPARAATTAAAKPAKTSEPFWGEHQSGILTPPQDHSYFAAFDLLAGKRAEVVTLLRRWTETAAALSQGGTVALPAMQPPAAQPVHDNGPGYGGSGHAAHPGGSGNDSSYGSSGDMPAATSESVDTGADSLDALGLGPARLTLTFGFGAGLFQKDGKDRYGLAALRPAALVDLPRFNGDQLIPARTGGDLSIQACADDPQVAFHAIRELSRLAYGVAQVRWVQTGFVSKPTAGGTPRNLLGFKDGTNVPQQIDKIVWAGGEGPAWMQGGSYKVVRRIRMALEHWDRSKVGFQEQTIGREKLSGAPLGLRDEFAPLGLDRTDKDGNPVIPDTAHVRLANADTNGGAEIFRRGYSYNDGADFTAERWPPWRQGVEYDAGLFFVCYQRDPRTGFIRIFENMARLDMLNQFVTHTGGGLFACPGGVRQGEFIGQKLFLGT
jgi:deferrochelatase/peroxidase EfeB